MDQDSPGPIGPNRAIEVGSPDWPETNEPGPGQRRLSRISVVIYSILALFVCIGATLLFFPGLTKKPKPVDSVQVNTPAIDPSVIANVVQRLSNLNATTNRTPSNPTPTPTRNTNSYYYNVDTDKDGVPDRIEIREGTEPRHKDTDEDGLNDFKELYIHMTDPKNEDTDGDSYLDGAEVSKGYNPAGPGRLQ